MRYRFIESLINRLIDFLIKCYLGGVHMRGGTNMSMAGSTPSNGTIRRRVQSPNRRDFKDFTSIRDIRSPNR